jgi:hypothetical protein
MSVLGKLNASALLLCARLPCTPSHRAWLRSSVALRRKGVSALCLSIAPAVLPQSLWVEACKRQERVTPSPLLLVFRRVMQANHHPLIRHTLQA